MGRVSAFSLCHFPRSSIGAVEASELPSAGGAQVGICMWWGHSEECSEIARRWSQPSLLTATASRWEGVQTTLNLNKLLKGLMESSESCYAHKCSVLWGYHGSTAQWLNSVIGAADTLGPPASVHKHKTGMSRWPVLLPSLLLGLAGPSIRPSVAIPTLNKDANQLWHKLPSRGQGQKPELGQAHVLHVKGKKVCLHGPWHQFILECILHILKCYVDVLTPPKHS